MLPLFDPPRDDAQVHDRNREQIDVKVKMVTGDAVAHRQEPAKTLGMGADILDATTLGDEKQQKTMATQGHREG